MVKFTLRVGDKDLVDRVDELAEAQGMTRTAYIIQLLQDAVEANYLPSQDGEGFRAVTTTGGVVTLIRHNDAIAGGMSNLSAPEQAAYEWAKKLAGSGGRWIEARRVLEEAGFKVSKL